MIKLYYELYDDYIDMFGNDFKFFDIISKKYSSFDIIAEDVLSIALKYGDVLIVCELCNKKFRYKLKCFIGTSQTEYKFNSLHKLNNKIIKMNEFINKHSCCIIICK
jgi:hypothetical protein